MKKYILFTLLFALVSFQANAAEWKIDNSHTAVKFKVKHILTNVWGEFTSYSGTVNYDAEKPAASSVSVNIDVSSIDTQNEKRDGHLKSPDFFDVENFPKISFVSKKVKKAADGLKVTGDLTIHGVTKEVVLDVEGPSDPVNFMGMTKIAASASTVINRTDYGLTWNKTLEAGNLLVGEEVTIVIDVELDRVD